MNVTAQGDATSRRQDAKWIDPHMIADAESLRVHDYDGGVDENVVSAAGNPERLKLRPLQELSIIVAHDWVGLAATMAFRVPNARPRVRRRDATSHCQQHSG